MSGKIACLIFISYIGAFQPNSNNFNQRIGENIGKSGFIDGDFIIGALFPIHSPPTNQINSLECGPIQRSEGVELVEAAFFAIDSINNNMSFLPGIKLGINIKDDCENERVALYQTIQMLKAPNSMDNVSNSSSTSFCAKKSNQYPLIGMMGTMTKLNMLHYENLLKLFKIPQIGYSTSLSELISPYFYLSVVPSDYHLAHLIIKILKKFNWNYIVVAYNDEYLGMNGKYFLEQWVSRHNICISNSIHIPRPRQNIKFVQSTKYLFQNEKAKVIVCFCDEDTLKNIFNEIKEFNLTGQYFVLSSNEWPLWEDQFEGYEEEAEGMMMLAPRNKQVEGFQTYVSNLDLRYNQRNPWYEEYLEAELPPLSDKSAKIAYVVRSIHTFAHGLRQMYFDVCERKTKECLGKKFDTEAYMKYLTNVSFDFEGEDVEFKFHGSPRIGKFDIYNFQETFDSYEFVTVGNYNCHHENVTGDDNVQHLNIFGQMKHPRDKKVISICSEECPLGHAQVNDKELLCCWQCLPCNETAYLVDKFNCKKCPKNHLPNKNKTNCTEAPLKYEKWNDTRSLIAISASSLIISLALTTAKVFVKNRHTPVVKTSSAPLHYIMLCGVVILSSANFILVIRPNFVVCILAKTLPSLAFSLIYLAVIFKMLQFYYVLKALKNRNSKFPVVIRSFKAQAIIIGIMIVSEATIMIGWTIIKEESIYEETFQTEPQTVALLRCVWKKKHWLDVLFVVMNLIMIYYGIKIRKMSHNFHEAKFLAIYTFVQSTTIVTFRIVYNSSDFQTVSMSMGFSLCSFITLLFLFFPKLYIIIWQPQINNDGNFKSIVTLYYSYNQ